MPNTIALRPADTRRLERLATAAGRTPAAMLPFVLRDGFDYCERTVKAVNEGLADLATGSAISAKRVHEKAREAIARHADKAA